MSSVKCAIVGAAITPTARSGAPGYSGLLLEAWAARLALEDSGLPRSAVDGAVHCMMASPHPPTQWIDAYSRVLGLRPNFYLNIARGGQAAHNGLLLASHVLNAGLATTVLVTCGLPGFSRTREPLLADEPPSTSEMTGISMNGFLNHGLGSLGFDAAASSAELHGLYATRHMYEFGTTKEELGAVALSARAWANLNPEARFFDRPATMDDYLTAPQVVWPYSRMDCCVQSDLGAALVVTTAERAGDISRSPVYVKEIGLGDQAREQWWEQTNYSQVDAAFALEEALRQADVTVEDIDVAQVYDCFTLEPILFAEGYGLCDRGEGGALAASGAFAPGGSFPTNTFGGLLAGMYLLDFPGVVEAVRQLRWECGDRQVVGAMHALTNGHGGELLVPAMCSSHATMILGREPR